MTDAQKFLQRAENAISESKHLDFKREFDATSLEAWCGLIKDIIAIANSGGGIIVFGISDDGTGSGIDPNTVLAIDSAEFTNKISKYTNYQFSDFEILTIARSGISYPAILIQATDIPIVFTKPGTYEVADGKQKTAFSQGTVYFRHGSKSEPGTRDDLQKWYGREIAKARRGWLTGIRKVVEAPPDHTVTVMPISSTQPTGPMAVSGMLTNDPNAAAFVPANAEQFWPHRQKDALKSINKKLPGAAKINGHDVFCINRIFDVLNKFPAFSYKSHKLSSPQYSDGYVKWVLEQYEQDQDFFQKMREEMKKRTRAETTQKKLKRVRRAK